MCALGTTICRAGSQAAFIKVDHDYVVAFASLGRALGVRHFGLVTSVGASPAARAFYLRTKGEAEEGVKALGYERLDIARPSFLIGERKETRSGEGWGIRISKLLAPLLVGPLTSIDPSRPRRWRGRSSISASGRRRVCSSTTMTGSRRRRDVWPGLLLGAHFGHAELAQHERPLIGIVTLFPEAPRVSIVTGLHFHA